MISHDVCLISSNSSGPYEESEEEEDEDLEKFLAGKSNANSLVDCLCLIEMVCKNKHSCVFQMCEYISCVYLPIFICVTLNLLFCVCY